MNDPNFRNRTLFHGDNLDFLRGMDSETVDLVATDPPFNKSRDFHATPDSLAAGARFEDRWSWDKDVHPDWVEAIKDDWPAVWQVIEAAIPATSILTTTPRAPTALWPQPRLQPAAPLRPLQPRQVQHVDPLGAAETKPREGLDGEELSWNRNGTFQTKTLPSKGNRSYNIFLS